MGFMTAVIDLPVAIAPWRIAQIRPWDRADVHRLFDACSVETIEHRFRARLPVFPARYLDELLAGPPERHDALTVRAGTTGELVALGSLAAPYGPNDGHTGELGLLVVDAWQRRGLGRALTSALVTRAAGRGVTQIVAEVEHGRGGLLTAMSRGLTPVARTAHRDGLTGIFTIPERPAIQGATIHGPGIDGPAIHSPAIYRLEP
jgi:GNAT superfamily N-acetyltransferase